jgi:hypothetical protein
VAVSFEKQTQGGQEQALGGAVEAEIAEGDLVVFSFDQATVADSDPEDVRCQLLESLQFLEAVPSAFLFQNPKAPGHMLVIDLKLLCLPKAAAAASQLHFRSRPRTGRNQYLKVG